MELIFGDKKSIEYAKNFYRQQRMEEQEKIIVVRSKCCQEFVIPHIEIEHPKDGRPGVTLIDTCSKCGKECETIKTRLK